MKNDSTPPVSRPGDLPKQSGKQRPVRILVADDDGDVRRVVTQTLSSAGYSVDAAEDGARAWETLQRKSYDLLITDNNMPKISGVELLDKLRTARIKLPVIMITAAVPVDEFSQKPWLVPEATVLKPFKVEDLLSKLRTLL